VPDSPPAIRWPTAAAGSGRTPPATPRAFRLASSSGPGPARGGTTGRPERGNSRAPSSRHPFRAWPDSSAPARLPRPRSTGAATGMGSCRRSPAGRGCGSSCGLLLLVIRLSPLDAALSAKRLDQVLQLAHFADLHPRRAAAQHYETALDPLRHALPAGQRRGENVLPVLRRQTLHLSVHRPFDLTRDVRQQRPHPAVLLQAPRRLRLLHRHPRRLAQLQELTGKAPRRSHALARVLGAQDERAHSPALLSRPTPRNPRRGASRSGACGNGPSQSSNRIWSNRL